MRIGIEHVDERLDSILYENLRAKIADADVSPSADLARSDYHYLRHLDPETLVASVAEAAVNLYVLMDAINAVADRAQRTLDIEDW